jgi:hypothetical protein
MDSFPKTFYLMIKPVLNDKYQHGLHLGTIESTAFKMAEEIFHRADRSTEPNDYVELMFDGKVVDTYRGWKDGKNGWDSTQAWIDGEGK